ncbi:hypothetical protein FALBO_14260 [Fusarium albosuccineum]|uniref:Uncharacterized protein n=1 Tax=Fusarium albosuccineum TaxID=1237068 RepID=A0A8H4P6C3_9HYPO|nr:hypothetical protein FALBO_14260 [Fusarium albosuccineum]
MNHPNASQAYRQTNEQPFSTWQWQSTTPDTASRATTSVASGMAARRSNADSRKGDDGTSQPSFMCGWQCRSGKKRREEMGQIGPPGENKRVSGLGWPRLREKETKPSRRSKDWERGPRRAAEDRAARAEEEATRVSEMATREEQEKNEALQRARAQEISKLGAEEQIRVVERNQTWAFS